MTSRTRPVPAKLGIKALNLKTKWPNVLKVIPSSGAVAAMPEKKTVSSLPTAIENGTRVLIPTHQQQFPGFRGTITIISIKPIDRSKSSIPPILIVPESQQHAPRPISTSLTQQFQQQQPLNSCTSSAAQTTQNRCVLKPVHLLQPVKVSVGNRICLSNPTKPLLIIIKKDDISRPLERKTAVKKSHAQVNMLPAPFNVRPIPGNEKPIASIQQGQALNNE